MRVLFLVEDTGSPCSAYTTFGRALAAQMKRAGHGVVLAHTRSASRQAAALGTTAPASPACYERVYALGLSRPRPFYPAHVLLCIGQTLRIIRKHKIDYVHLHFHGRDDWFWGITRFLAGRPYGLTWHSVDSAAWGLGRRAYITALVAGSAWTAAISRFVRGQLSTLWPAMSCKLHVVYPGADHSARVARLSAVPHRRNPFILFVGRMTMDKGVGRLLLAFNDLAKECPELDLVLCGPRCGGDGWEQVIELLRLKGRVFCLGTQDRSAVAALMQGCLFLALPSHRESLGMSALEAMAHGKTVVAGRVGGITEYLNDENGILLENESPEELCRAMRRLIEDPGLRQRLGDAARRTADRYKWCTAADAYLELCRLAATGGPA